MRLGLVTDSTSDLPAFLIEQHGIEVVPTILVMDGKEYADGPELSRQEFYVRLPSLRNPPTTAAPSIGEFAARYDRLLTGGSDRILSIHAPEALTSIVGSARQAAHDFASRVTVVDGRSLSLGLGFQVLAAAEAADGGLPAALQAVEATRRGLQVFAALDTMKYLRRSGRLPGALTILGGLLSIKPLIELSNGEVRAIGAVRTTRQADARILQFLQAAGGLERLAILHTGAEERAREFLTAVMNKARLSMPRDILMVTVTPVIGAHVGPNGLGFAGVRIAE